MKRPGSRSLSQLLATPPIVVVRSHLLEGSGNGYLRTVCDYVHLNPVRAKLIKTDESREVFPWSSYGFYLKRPGKKKPREW